MCAQLDAAAASRTSGYKHGTWTTERLTTGVSSSRTQQQTSLYIHRLWTTPSWCSAVWARKWQTRRVVRGWMMVGRRRGEEGETFPALWLDLLRWRVLWAGPDGRRAGGGDCMGYYGLQPWLQLSEGAAGTQVITTGSMSGDSVLQPWSMQHFRPPWKLTCRTIKTHTVLSSQTPCKKERYRRSFIPTAIRLYNICITGWCSHNWT